jgi:protein involved in polysaccharide export with SLBB domain
MRKRRTRTRGGRLLLLAALAGLAGCSSPSGGRLSLFPEGHKLLDSARWLREAHGPPPGEARELDKSPAGPYVVEPGDVLLVQPVSLESPVRLPGDQPVLPDGTIQLGRYGRWSVAGKTVEIIETEVNGIIGEKVKDAGPITVRLVTRDSKVFYVLGEVNAPGAFQLKGRETVLDAVLAAGGLNSNASRRGILLTRPTPPGSCRVVLPVHYNHIVQLGDTTTNYQIRAGDRVFVPSTSLWEDFKACFEKKKDPGPPPVACPPHEGPPVDLGPPAHVAAPPPPAAGIGPVEPLPPPAPAPAPAPAGKITQTGAEQPFVGLPLPEPKVANEPDPLLPP